LPLFELQQHEIISFLLSRLSRHFQIAVEEFFELQARIKRGCGTASVMWVRLLNMIGIGNSFLKHTGGTVESFALENRIFRL